jgi:phage baseplate assembly protein W
MALFVNRAPDYTDIDLDFRKHPTTKDVMMKTGDEAIKRSIRNLIFTNFYDRPFQSYIGSNVRGLLFENITPFTAVLIKSAIEQTINNFEKRVRLMSVDVESDPDNNGFNVRLQYVILNRELPITTSLFLERIR